MKHIHQAKKAVSVPIIASLNGATVGGWTQYALIQQAGADALECNIYSIPTDPELTSNAVEQQYLDILQAVKSGVTIPVAVSSAPFSAIWPTWRSGFDQAGANGLVLFNRFYQPDINLDELEIQPNVLLGTPQALRLPLTRIGILYGRIRASLAATSGVHGPEDVVKLLMVGADVTMLCSTLLRHGIGQLEQIEEGVLEWMEKHEYESVQQMKGSMSQIRCPDPSAFERAQYIKAVKSVQHVVLTGREARRILSGD